VNKYCLILMIGTISGSIVYFRAGQHKSGANPSPAVIATCVAGNETRQLSRPRNRPASPVLKWTKIVCNVSAYCPCEICCGEYADGVTASGQDVNGPVRHWIAAPARYPFGTVFRIPGYDSGRPVCVLDRGGAIKGNKLDLYFPTHTEALGWGRQIITVEVLKGIE
jgi:3D (Asp-Asp-Asp) domain-containing protein